MNEYDNYNQSCNICGNNNCNCGCQHRKPCGCGICNCFRNLFCGCRR